LKPGDLWTSIPQPLLEDCAQLTKANSIEGTHYLLNRLINPSRLSDQL
jgi:hypothetical protein